MGLLQLISFFHTYVVFSQVAAASLSRFIPQNTNELFTKKGLSFLVSRDSSASF
jgi:hypothetical protein